MEVLIIVSFKSRNIRNIVILGHGSSGKTTLTEACAYVTGVVSRFGKTEDGNTLSDFDKEEIRRGFSINMSLVPVIQDEVKLNFLDTPGYFDFVGETVEALEAADAAVIVVSGKRGVEAGTLKAWEYCEKKQIPRIFFVTDLDDGNADFEAIVEKLAEYYGEKVVPFQVPLQEEDAFWGYVELISMQGRKFQKNQEEVDCEIPEKLKEMAETYRLKILENIAETNEELLEKYFDGVAFSKEEISTAIKESISKLDLVPVFLGSGLKAQGITELLKAAVEYFPSPEGKVHMAVNSKEQEEIEVICRDDAPVSVQVFKTIADPFIGKYSLFHVMSGILRPDVVLYNRNTEKEERVNRFFILSGKEQQEVNCLFAGDIGAFQKLAATATFDTLSVKEFPVLYSRPELPVPYTYIRYEAEKKGEDEKISQALSKLLDEDLTLKTKQDPMNHQSLLYGMGDLHIKTALSKLFNRYKVEIAALEPKVPYMETITGFAKVQGKYKKQSGGHGQYGDVHMEFTATGDYALPYVFEEKIFGGAVPKNYFPAVEKGIAESVKSGLLAGFPVVGVKAVLVDGSYHPVDSSELAFKMAAIMAFKQAFIEAKPVLLEPIVEMHTIIPNRYSSDILGDFNKRRGRVLGMNQISKEKKEIICELPLEETFGYSTTLRSMTAGLGEYRYDLVRYEQTSPLIQEKIIKKYKEMQEK